MAGLKSLILTVLVVIIHVHVQYCHGDNGDHPRGHLERLGSHIDSDGHVEIYDHIPSAREFWEKHVRHRKPAVFRGIAKKFDAYNRWTDEYMIQKFGDLEVKLEAKAEKKNIPIGSKGKGRDTISDFLHTYVKKDSYIVSQIPDPMSAEVGVLPCITCGSFKNRILEANLWLSSGGTKSLLHKDADNAINCLLNGTKDWLLIHPKYEKFIPMAQEARSEVGGFSVINVDKVNIEKYPDFKKVHYNHANLSPGDCLYLPYAYLHQVRSYGSKNMAVSVLFAAGLTHEKAFKDEGCDSQDNTTLAKLTEVNMVWTYPGHGAQTLGSMDPMELRDNILRHFEKRSKISSKQFLKELTAADDEEDEGAGMIKWQQKAYNKHFGLDKKEFVTADEVNSMTFDDWKTLAVDMDPDPANTEEYEYALFNPKQIRKIIEKSFNRKEKKIDAEKFIKKYMKIGGSEKIAGDILHKLDSNNDGVVDNKDLTAKGEDVLKLFKENAMPPKKVIVKDEDYLKAEEEDARNEAPDEDEEDAMGDEDQEGEGGQEGEGEYDDEEGEYPQEDSQNAEEGQDSTESKDSHDEL